MGRNSNVWGSYPELTTMSRKDICLEWHPFESLAKEEIIRVIFVQIGGAKFGQSCSIISVSELGPQIILKGNKLR